MTMRVIAQSVIVALSLCAWGCGSDSGGPSVAPTAMPAPNQPGDVVAIDVVRENGAQSFSPNPATLPAGQMVVWHNIDTVVHRVVLNDGSVDTGDLAAGAASRPMIINAGGYHCSIHPSMVGTVVQAASSASSDH